MPRPISLETELESARAVWKGMVLVAHHSTIRAKSMYWALPGGTHAHGTTLKAIDPHFQVLIEPSKQRLEAGE